MTRPRTAEHMFRANRCCRLVICLFAQMISTLLGHDSAAASLRHAAASLPRPPRGQVRSPLLLWEYPAFAAHVSYWCERQGRRNTVPQTGRPEQQKLVFWKSWIQGQTPGSETQLRARLPEGGHRDPRQVGGRSVLGSVLLVREGLGRVQPRAICPEGEDADGTRALEKWCVCPSRDAHTNPRDGQPVPFVRSPRTAHASHSSPAAMPCPQRSQGSAHT